MLQQLPMYAIQNNTPPQGSTWHATACEKTSGCIIEKPQEQQYPQNYERDAKVPAMC